MQYRKLLLSCNIVAVLLVQCCSNIASATNKVFGWQFPFIRSAKVNSKVHYPIDTTRRVDVNVMSIHWRQNTNKVNVILTYFCDVSSMDGFDMLPLIQLRWTKNQRCLDRFFWCNFDKKKIDAIFNTFFNVFLKEQTCLGRFNTLFW